MVMMIIIIITTNHQSPISNQQSSIINHQSSASRVSFQIRISNSAMLLFWASLQFCHHFPNIKLFNAKEHQETVGCSHHGGISSRDVLRRDQKAMVKNGCSINLITGVAIFPC